MSTHPTIHGSQYAYPNGDDTDWGLTKREVFAMAAMQGLLAHRGNDAPNTTIAIAVHHADLLIQALNEPPKAATPS